MGVPLVVGYYSRVIRLLGNVRASDGCKKSVICALQSHRRLRDFAARLKAYVNTVRPPLWEDR